LGNGVPVIGQKRGAAAAAPTVSPIRSASSRRS
jgi:hypothetical protein